MKTSAQMDVDSVDSVDSVDRRRRMSTVDFDVDQTEAFNWSTSTS